jgi:hypothetical protein
MSGLSPDALCRIFQHSVQFLLSFKSSRNQKFLLTQSKNLSKLLLAARSALNLYECAVSASNADLTLWIFKEQPIIEINQSTQSILKEDALH